jgi:histidinol dehydrogenase|tara:strand:- start:789 stop:2054 length:1266 start_codon:yes stop_codon:yes gene_type:complete
MIKINKFTNSRGILKLEQVLDKRRVIQNTNISVVSKILKDIRKNKNKALIKYEKKFSKNSRIKPSSREINKAIRSLNPKIKKAIDYAYNRIFKYHSLQKVKNINYRDKLKNTFQYKSVPINKVGVYVPANLPSTLLMNAIPAKIAGVKKIILANPRLNNKLNPAIIYAAKKLGIKEIYSMGGAQAIGSLTYIQKVDKIVGPGNIYVAKAKKEVFGDVGVEGMVAGPSEITVVADKKTEIKSVITSLIGQAEHDVNSQCIIISKDLSVLKEIKNLIKINLKNLPRRKIAEKSLKANGLLIYAKNDKNVIDLINLIAPEHLELNITKPKKYINKIVNAGSICLGKFSAMAVTDYNAGTNHVLPTMGSAKFSSGLNVGDFFKKISYINLSKKGIEVIGKQAITLAEYENLEGHAQSIKSRIRSY